MHELLPGFYDHLEPVALAIAKRAARMAPAGPQPAYLVDTSRKIVDSGCYRSTPPGPAPVEIRATLTWLELIDRHLDGFVSGALRAEQIIGQGGGRLWASFQADEPFCAAYAEGVARALRPRIANKRVMELGAGTGGTTRRVAAELETCRQFVLTDVRQSFIDRIASDLPGVHLDKQLLDIDRIDGSQSGSGCFDVIFATNCVHVARDVHATLAGLRTLLAPGGVLLLGEGSHYPGDVPSPLSVILSLFDSWWDAPRSQWRPEPGFLSGERWLGALAAAGFERASAESWHDSRRTFGGLYWAFAP